MWFCVPSWFATWAFALWFLIHTGQTRPEGRHWGYCCTESTGVWDSAMLFPRSRTLLWSPLSTWAFFEFAGYWWLSLRRQLLDYDFCPLQLKSHGLSEAVTYYAPRGLGDWTAWTSKAIFGNLSCHSWVSICCSNYLRTCVLSVSVFAWWDASLDFWLQCFQSRWSKIRKNILHAIF